MFRVSKQVVLYIYASCKDIVINLESLKQLSSSIFWISNLNLCVIGDNQKLSSFLFSFTFEIKLLWAT